MIIFFVKKKQLYSHLFCLKIIEDKKWGRNVRYKFGGGEIKAVFKSFTDKYYKAFKVAVIVSIFFYLPPYGKNWDSVRFVMII